MGSTTSGIRRLDWIRDRDRRWKLKPRKIALTADPRKLRSPEFLVPASPATRTGGRGRRTARRRTVRAACECSKNTRTWTSSSCTSTLRSARAVGRPKQYVDLYTEYQGDEVNYPTTTSGGTSSASGSWSTAARCTGEATLVDRWFGVLLDTLDDLGMAEDTASSSERSRYLFGEHGHTANH